MLSGAAKAVVAGLFAGAGGLAILLGADAEIVAAVEFILAPLAVYLVPNAPQ